MSVFPGFEPIRPYHHIDAVYNEHDTSRASPKWSEMHLTKDLIVPAGVTSISSIRGSMWGIARVAGGVAPGGAPIEAGGVA
jgi:hypothetical protein